MLRTSIFNLVVAPCSIFTYLLALICANLVLERTSSHQLPVPKNSQKYSIAVMADQTAQGGLSVYPLPPGDYGDTGYRYEDAPQPPPATIPPPPQQQPVYAEQRVDSSPGPVPPSTTKSKSGGEVKPRLRKACDSCSVRKVKVWCQMLTQSMLVLICRPVRRKRTTLQVVRRS